MRPIGLAISGCGRFGSHMAGIIAGMREFQIVAAYDPDGERADQFGGNFGAPAFDAFDACLAHPDVEAVALFGPNNVHRWQTLAAARAHKHIFCEKPMALSTEACYEMLEAADHAGVRLMVGHKRRLRPQYVRMAEVVRSMRFGRVLAVNINGFFYREVHDWWRRRDYGGGLLQYAGVHDIDFLRHILGEASVVFACSPVKTDHRTDFEDAMSLIIQFETGTVASIQVCALSPLRTFHQSFGVQIVFERGGILYDPHALTVTVQGYGEQPEITSYDNEAGFQEAYRTEWKSFAGWVRCGENPVLTGWDGLRCVEIMEAAVHSAATGKAVQLPLPRNSVRAAATSPCNRNLREPALFARGLSMPEGPAFDREGNLFVANCRADYVSQVTPDGQVSRFATTGGKTQGVAIHPDGALFVTDFLARSIFRITPGGQCFEFCTRYDDGRPLGGPNEIAFGPNGQLYFTDPGHAPRERASGAFCRVESGGLAETLAGGLGFTNGFDFSPDGSMVYLVESSACRILRAPLSSNGTLAGPFSEFVRFPGRRGPDGIRFAANGDLYVALFGHGLVAVVSPDGEIVERLRVPGLFPTNLIFVNSDLLVCEGQTGALWRLPLGIQGLPSYAQRIWHAEHAKVESI